MPIYEFECRQCAFVFEEFGTLGVLRAQCPRCGAIGDKIMSVSNFHLKGSGFYATDYKRPSEPKNKSEA